MASALPETGWNFLKLEIFYSMIFTDWSCPALRCFGILKASVFRNCFPERLKASLHSVVTNSIHFPFLVLSFGCSITFQEFTNISQLFLFTKTVYKKY